MLIIIKNHVYLEKEDSMYHNLNKFKPAFNSVLFLLTIFLNPLFVFSENLTEKAESFLEEKEETPFKIHGLIHLEAEDAQKDADEKGIPIFEFEHVFLRFESNPSQNAKVILEMTQHEDHNPAFIQAFGTWEFNNLLTLKTGKFLMPFGLQDKIYYCSLRWTNHLPEVLTDIIPDRWNETGIAFAGNIQSEKVGINYDVAITNGLKGLSKDDIQTIDNNSNKLLGGRISFDIKQLNFGLSYANQKYDSSQIYDLNFTGGHIEFTHKQLNFRGEYITAQTEDETGKFNKKGFYTEMMYSIPFEKIIYCLQPVIRYSDFDPNDKVKDNKDFYSTLLGIRICLSETIIFKFEYNVIKEKNPPELSNDALKIGATYAF